MVNTPQNALRLVKERLHKRNGGIVKKERFFDGGRKAFLEMTNGEKYAVLFKTRRFLTYESITGIPGSGDTINEEDYDCIVYEFGCRTVLYVYPDNTIYTVTTKDIAKNSIRYKNIADGKEQYLFSADIMVVL